MADVKFSELDVLSAADSGDIFAVVDTSASTSKKLSIDNLFGTVPVDVRVTDATESSSITTGSLRTAGGVGIVKALQVGLTSTLTGAVTATAGVFPAAADGAALGSAALEWSDLFLADGAVINLGADQDVTLTHVADTGVQVNSTMKLMFNDASQFVQGTSATVLSIGATDEIDLTATAVDLNGTLNASGLVTIQTGMVPDASDGAYLGTTALQFSDIFLADAAVINLGDDQDVTLTHVADTGVQVNSTMKMMFNDATQFVQGISATVLGLGATDEIDLTATAVDINATVNASGLVTIQTGMVPDASDGAYLGTSSLEFSDLFLADEAVISMGDGGADVTLTHVADTGVQVNDTNKIMFHDTSQFIQGVSATVLGLGATDEIDLTATAIDINGTVNASGLVTVQTGIVADAQDGAYLGTSSLQFSDLFLADGGTITMGDDAEVIITHVADSGITLSHETTGDNLPVILTLESSEAAVVADEVLGQIDFKPTVGSSDGAAVCAGIAAVAEGTFSDSNNAAKLSFKTAASEVAAEKMALSSTGVLTVTGSVVPSASDGAALGTAALEWSDLFLADAGVINLGADQDVTLTHVADTGVLLNSDNVIQFRDTGLTIGSSADGTLDVVADTILDLDAATVTLTKAGADQVVKHATDTYDLAFQQTDGNEVARIHDGSTAATLETGATDLTAGAAGKGGFGFKRPVYNVTSASADDADVALAMKHSGAMILVTGSGYDMDIILPVIAAGDEGWHVTIAIKTAFSSTNNLEIATNGHGDATDRIFLYMNTAGTSGAEATANDDVLKFVDDVAAGTLINMTCIQGGTNEFWVAEVLQPAGTAATTTATMA